MDELPDVEIAVDGAVAEVRLHRPSARNAFSRSLMRQLTQAAERFRASTDIQAVILTGAETYFSAGADLADPDRAQGVATRLQRRQVARLGPDLCQAWEDLEQVTIAAVEGYCIGGAAALALAWGMVDSVTTTGGALVEARAWAAKVAALPPIPVRMTKEAINAAAGALHRAASLMDRDQWMLTSETSDFAEGARAFFEKREPKFRGD